jgi:hypothetical protein
MKKVNFRVKNMQITFHVDEPNAKSFISKHGKSARINFDGFVGDVVFPDIEKGKPFIVEIEVTGVDKIDPFAAFTSIALKEEFFSLSNNSI